MSCARYCDSPEAPRSLRKNGGPTHLGVVRQHVIPQDGCPGIGHLTDVGDHHNWQGVGLWRERGMSWEAEGPRGFPNLFTHIQHIPQGLE